VPKRKEVVSTPVRLFYKKFGEQGPPVVILHGMFGMSDNWQTIAKALTDNHIVYLLDARNHGRSPHTDEMNYDLMADDVNRFMEQEGLEKSILMGHSMGGKTAMNFAAKYPEKVDRLIVVDIVPKEYPPAHTEILRAMESVDLNVGARREVESQLTRLVSEPKIALFLMKNLRRKPSGGFEWKLNLDAFKNHYNRLIGRVDPRGPHYFDVLLIRGENSPYVSDRDWSSFKEEFPNARLVEIPKAGHWVHSEQPEVFLKENSKIKMK